MKLEILGEICYGIPLQLFVLNGICSSIDLDSIYSIYLKLSLAAKCSPFQMQIHCLPLCNSYPCTTNSFFSNVKLHYTLKTYLSPDVNF